MAEPRRSSRQTVGRSILVAAGLQSSWRETARDVGRTLRQVLNLQLGRHLTLFVILDFIWLGQSVVAALLAGDAAERSVYALGALGALLVLGIPALAELVAVERRSGCLDLALTAPSGEAYFLVRVALVAALLLVQGEMLMLFVWVLGGRSFSLGAVVAQLAVCTALTAAVTFFWAVRLHSGGAAWLASLVTLLVLGRWFFYSPIPQGPRDGGTLLPSLEAAAAQAPALMVLTAAVVLFMNYGRRRLRRPASLLD